MSKLVIYMKSGNQIKLRGVKDWKVSNQGDSIVHLKIEVKWWAKLFSCHRLVMNSIALSEIEAITTT